MAEGFGFTLLPHLKVYHDEKEQREYSPLVSRDITVIALEIHSTDV